MTKKVNICEISLSPDADRDEFEKFMKTEIFRTVSVGQQTRGGIVTAQYLVKAGIPESEPNYSWVVEWVEEGGSPFGAQGVPNDPADRLTAFGASTSSRVLEVVAAERHTREGF